jgi:NADH:ubiquinone oxidoreductase subunit 3 (subunit A)
VPSGWEVYYVVFLSALLALTVPLVLHLVSSAISERATRPPEHAQNEGFSAWAEKTRQAEPHDSIGRRINTRFFLGTNAALVLLTLGLMLIPCVGAFHEIRAELGGRALISILLLAGLSALALLYAARKGDLEWLRTVRGGRR